MKDKGQIVIKRLLGETMSTLDEFVESGDMKEGAYNELSKRLKLLYDVNSTRQNVIVDRTREKRFFIRLLIENPHLLCEYPDAVDVDCPIFLGKVFVARRVANAAWSTESEESWFSSILSFYLPTDSNDERSTEDFEGLADGIEIVIHGLRKNLANNTRLTIEKCCEWIVDDLRKKHLYATDLFDGRRMLTTYLTSESDPFLLDWMKETATSEQRVFLDQAVGSDRHTQQALLRATHEV